MCAQKIVTVHSSVALKCKHESQMLCRSGLTVQIFEAASFYRIDFFASVVEHERKYFRFGKKPTRLYVEMLALFWFPAAAPNTMHIIGGFRIQPLKMFEAERFSPYKNRLRVSILAEHVSSGETRKLRSRYG